MFAVYVMGLTMTAQHFAGAQHRRQGTPHSIAISDSVLQGKTLQGFCLVGVASETSYILSITVKPTPLHVQICHTDRVQK